MAMKLVSSFCRDWFSVRAVLVDLPEAVAGASCHLI